MKKNRLSVKDIAELAGTSVATVSRVINQNGRFSKETEQRVKSIMEEYGYQPNQLARGLRVSRTQVIGILVPDLMNEFFASIVKEVQKTLLEKKYMTLICSTNENVMEAQDQIRMLLGQKVDGIIYIGGDDIVESIHIPIVFIDRDPRDNHPGIEDYALFECDNIQGGYLAGCELAEKGAKNIAYVCFNTEFSTTKKRLMGFEKALKENNIELPLDCGVHVEEVSIEAGRTATEYIINHMKNVDGIFFMSDILAIGGLEYVNSVGIKVPEQMKIVGFDDISFGRITTPKLTTIHQPVDRMGQAAANCIMDMIEGNEIDVKRQRIPVSLVVRATT